MQLTKTEFRRRIELARVDAAGRRPACDLVSETVVDDDGRIWLDFFCVDHEASWRELIAVSADGHALETAPVAATSGDTAHGVSADEAEGRGE